MKKNYMLVFTVLAILLLSSTVVAQEDGFSELDILFSSVEGQELPSSVQKFVKNGNVNLYIEDIKTYSLQVKEGILTSVSNDASQDPVLDLYVSVALLEKISSSDNGLATLKRAKKEGDFTYKAYGFFNKIKFGVLFSLLDLSPEMDSEEVNEPTPDEINYTSKRDSAKKAKSDNSGNGQGITAAVVSGSYANQGSDNSEESEESDEQDANGLDAFGGFANINDGSNENVEEELETQTTSEEVSEEIIEEVEEPKDTETSGLRHLVAFTDEGFSPEVITISVGDTIVWENKRGTKNPKLAMLIGTRASRSITSDSLNPGESYSWTFKEAKSHVFVDGVMTTKTMKVIVK